MNIPLATDLCETCGHMNTWHPLDSELWCANQECYDSYSGMERADEAKLPWPFYKTLPKESRSS